MAVILVIFNAFIAVFSFSTLVLTFLIQAFVSVCLSGLLFSSFFPSNLFQQRDIKNMFQ